MRKLVAVLFGTLGVWFLTQALYLPTSVVLEVILSTLFLYFSTVFFFPIWWLKELSWEEQRVVPLFPWYRKTVEIERRFLEEIARWD